MTRTQVTVRLITFVMCVSSRFSDTSRYAVGLYALACRLAILKCLTITFSNDFYLCCVIYYNLDQAICINVVLIALSLSCTTQTAIRSSGNPYNYPDLSLFLSVWKPPPLPIPSHSIRP
jgi:hypothetical protein